MTEEQIAEFREGFSLIIKDSDSDGVTKAKMIDKIRKALCEYKRDNCSCIQRDLRMWLEDKFHLNVSQGELTLDELASAMQALNVHPIEEEIEPTMNLGEAEESGTVDFEEILYIMARKMKENVAEEVKEAFKVFDRDQDGFISAIELKNVMLNLGERLSDEEAEQMIGEADLDGDGLVSYEDFARTMMTC